MASFFKNLDKQIKDWHILTFLGLLVLGYVIYEYSGRQNRLINNYQGGKNYISAAAPVAPVSKPNSGPVNNKVSQGMVPPIDPMSDSPNSLNSPSSFSQVSSSQIAPVPTTPGSVSVQPINPSDLLPSGSAGQQLSGNFLNSRELSIGMQSQVLRNANQTIRKDPVIPVNQGPPCQFQSNITSEMGGGGLNVDC
tara:strand:+ start:8762 stop:9343 length:582 start_codon:yes stop_codon:yes gene_type:complete